MRTADVVTRVPCIRPGHCAVLLRVGFHEKRVPLSRDIIMLRDPGRSSLVFEKDHTSSLVKRSISLSLAW